MKPLLAISIALLAAMFTGCSDDENNSDAPSCFTVGENVRDLYEDDGREDVMVERSQALDPPDIELRGDETVCLVSLSYRRDFRDSTAQVYGCQNSASYALSGRSYQNCIALIRG